MRELELIWSECKEIIQSNIPSQSFKTWFNPIVPLKLEDSILLIQVPNQFFYEWIEEHYSELIQKVLYETTGEELRLKYVIENKDNGEYQPTETIREKFRIPDNETQLNKRYTFDSFIEGSSNQFAKAASLAVAESPGKTSYNPLLVYGGVGLGKTHLIQAIGNFAQIERTTNKILYVSSEKFTIDFINAIKNSSTNKFSEIYRSIDLILVDDVQFFIDKERTQEEFFHTFNTLHHQNKQIVLSCDRPPSELKGLEERLVSRFQSGLVVDIQPPDLETRIAILHKKAEEEGIGLDQEIAEFIANHITSNIRELEGALIKLLAYASLTDKILSTELTRQILKDIAKPISINISIENIQKVVSQYYDLPVDLLRAKTRKQEVANARMLSMYLSKKITSNSLKTIGLLHGGKDHSTVIHALKTVEAKIEDEPKLRDVVENLQKKIEYL